MSLIWQPEAENLRDYEVVACGAAALAAVTHIRPWESDTGKTDRHA
jgi:hypothetical protein